MCRIFLALSFFIFFLFNLEARSDACACGCGVFDVGTSSMFPSGQGGSIFEEYDFMDQKKNWRHSSKAAAYDNDDKQIRSSFITAGFQYMFNRQWGMQIELPYDHRYFRRDLGNGGSPDIKHFLQNSVGDMRLQGIYTGFSEDMSTGITFGFKFPTGNWKASGFDRDTEIGSGSTDALIGAFHRGQLTADGSIDYFMQNLLGQPFLTQGGYIPGTEDNAAAGLYYNGLRVGHVRVTPIAELENSYRSKDRGWAANSSNSGYERILLAPAIELDYKRFMVFFEVGFPVYQFVDGNQLVAPVYYKTSLSYIF